MRGQGWLALVGWLVVGCGAPQPAIPPVSGDVVVSFFALGDTGVPPKHRAYQPRQQVVARALAARDQARAADALVLLGDNFYPDGLHASELERRVRFNLVAPYCRFVALSPLGEERLGSSCPLEQRANPVPIYAVLGNHDYNDPESPALQRDEIPRYLPGWHAPHDGLEVVELEGGVTLILLESTPLVHGSALPDLAAAVAGAKGRWRVLVLHHPIADPGHGFDERVARPVLEALRTVDKRVHLVLAGHEHSLQAIALDPPDPPLNVVAGSGADLHRFQDTSARRLYGEEVYGFARIDLVRRGTVERLVASLVRVEPVWPWRRPRVSLGARVSVSHDGALEVEVP